MMVLAVKPEEHPDAKRGEVIRFNRFRRFIKHFTNESYKFMTKEDVDYAINETKAKFFGVEEFLQKFKSSLCNSHLNGMLFLKA